MNVYWLSFRISEQSSQKGSYSDRYDKLVAAIGAVADQSCWWFETTSFYVFRSDSQISDIAAHLKSAIDPQLDLVVIGMPDFKNGRVIGNCQDQDIFKLVPFMKKV